MTAKFLVSVIHQELGGSEGNLTSPLAIVDERKKAIEIARKFDRTEGPYVMTNSDHGVFVTQMEEGKLYSNRDPALPFFTRLYDSMNPAVMKEWLSPMIV